MNHSAAADSSLCTDVLRYELENRSCIVIQTSYDIRVDSVRNADRLKSCLESFEVSLAVITKVIDESRCILDDVLAAVDLAVDHSQRVLFESCLAVLTHSTYVRSEMILEYLVILAPAGRASN